MDINGIIFEYMTGYGFDAELIHKWVVLHTPVTSVHRT